MITNYKVDVYNRLPSTKVNGITIKGALFFIKSIDVDIQPFSRRLLLKSYGYDLEVTKRIFMEVDQDVKIGTILKYTDSQNKTEEYEVKAIPWDDGYYEVMCNGI